MYVMEEFWGLEVKNGECPKVSPGDGRVLHLSQASLGELNDKNGKENVNLFVNVDGKKLVLGTLITNKLPQYQFDVSFDRDFEVSHNWKSGSVYLYGYKASKSPKDELFKGESGHTELKVEKVLDDGHTELKVEKVLDAGQTELKVENVLDDGQTKLKVEKVSDAGRDLVKIAETNKDLNTQEEDETTFEEVMSDDDGKDDSQVATSKKRSLESVECATATPIPKKKKKKGRRGDIYYENGKAKIHPCKMCYEMFVSVEAAQAHAKDTHS